MRRANCPGLTDSVMANAIPMRGRMIHGKRATGELYEVAQDYDAYGRVNIDDLFQAGISLMSLRAYMPLTAVTSTNASWMYWNLCLM